MRIDGIRVVLILEINMRVALLSFLIDVLLLQRSNCKKGYMSQFKYRHKKGRMCSFIACENTISDKNKTGLCKRCLARIKFKRGMISNKYALKSDVKLNKEI